MTGLTTFAMSRTGQLCRAHKSAVAQFCRSLRRQSGQTRGFFHGLLPHQNQDQFLRGAQDEKCSRLASICAAASFRRYRHCHVGNRHSVPQTGDR